MAKIRVTKDNYVLIDVDVETLVVHLLCGYSIITHRVAPPYTIETYALDKIEITQVKADDAFDDQVKV